MFNEVLAKQEETNIFKRAWWGVRGFFWYQFYGRFQKSNLEKHAEEELKLAGWFDKRGIYGGMVGKSVMALVKAQAGQGHSGMSHSLVLSIFNKVVNLKALTPLTPNPAEWQEYMPGKFQSRRQSSCFSDDGLKTYYDIDDPTKQVRNFEKEKEISDVAAGD